MLLIDAADDVAQVARLAVQPRSFRDHSPASLLPLVSVALEAEFRGRNRMIAPGAFALALLDDLEDDFIGFSCGQVEVDVVLHPEEATTSTASSETFRSQVRHAHVSPYLSSLFYSIGV